ncbi:MAG: BspA family leucine-rich repeat surface protein, partial [Lachnospiraceae bacterium]|nr:BspA family leucine-rich repeat surface protein [Lachnospiraceae bacterium]
NGDTSNVTNMSYMFNAASSFNQPLGSWNTAKVTDMSGMFDTGGFGDGLLTTLDVSGFDTSMVTDMNDMFSGCTSLETLDVSGFNTSKVTDMRYMFNLCDKLTSIDVSGFETGKVTDMGFLFCGCDGITSLDVSSFDTSNVGDMRHMFEDYEGESLDLSSFELKEGVETSYMFYHNPNLKTIFVSSDWDDSKIGADYGKMFYDCPQLIGENRTEYSNDHKGKDYARIDGEEGSPGYLTRKDPTTYRVVFNCMGGTIGTDKVVKQDVARSGPATVTTPGFPTRDGCTFAGWYTSDGNSAFDLTTPITDHTFLYARWNEPALVPAAAPVDCTHPGNIKHYTKNGRYFTKRGNQYREVRASDVIKELPHNYVNGKCAVCGADDPAYYAGSKPTDNVPYIPPFEGSPKKEETAGPETIVTKNPDGSETTTTIERGDDGSVTTTEVTVDKDGNVTKSVETVKEYPNGIVRSQKQTEYPDGSVLEEAKTQKPGGSEDHTAVLKDKDGNVLSETSDKVRVRKDGRRTETSKTSYADGSVLGSVKREYPSGRVNETLYALDEGGEGTYTKSVARPDGSKETADYDVTKNGVSLRKYTYAPGPGTDVIKKVTIPDSVKIDGTEYPVTSVEKNAFRGNTQIKTVRIGRNILIIASNAFRGAVNLGKLYLPATLTKIGKNAFLGVGELTVYTCVPEGMKFKDAREYLTKLLAKSGYDTALASFRRAK